jgi:hypothetical protein
MAKNNHNNKACEIMFDSMDKKSTTSLPRHVKTYRYDTSAITLSCKVLIFSSQETNFGKHLSVQLDASRRILRSSIRNGLFYEVILFKFGTIYDFKQAKVNVETLEAVKHQGVPLSSYSKRESETDSASGGVAGKFFEVGSRHQLGRLSSSWRLDCDLITRWGSEWLAVSTVLRGC